MGGLVDFSLGDIGGVFTDIRRALTGEEIKDPQKVLDRLTEFETTLMKAKSVVIEAEAKSEHWLVSAWRPITMLVFVAIIANNYIIVPYASALFSVQIPTLELTDQMWELLKIGLGGYIVGRSVEKAVKHYKS
jgi:hypothetical protein